MDSSKAKSGWLQLSLRELLLLLAFCGAGCAALKYAGGTWELTLSAGVLALFMAAAVMAVVDRGRRQAGAIGLALCLVIYGALIWSAPINPNRVNRELDLGAGQLPTSKALQPLYESLVVRSNETVDATTINPAVSWGRTGPGGPPPTFTVQVETPDRHAFMTVGHWLWALLLGYAGCRVALWCYDRRERRQ